MKLSCKNVLYGTKKFLNPEKRKLKEKRALLCAKLGMKIEFSSIKWI